MHSTDTRQLRDVCASFATGVTIVSTRTEEGDHGMTANAFMSVSLEPPLVTISLDHNSRMREKIQQSGRYAVSVLPEHMQDVAMHFAGRHNPELGEVFEDRGDMPVIAGASAVFLTEVEHEIEAGDHTLFIGRVTTAEHDKEAKPLLFCGGRFYALAS